MVAPRYAAKLITSPSFVKWLTTPLTNPNGISAHLGRLVAIAVAEPELREAIEGIYRGVALGTGWDTLTAFTGNGKGYRGHPCRGGAEVENR